MRDILLCQGSWLREEEEGGGGVMSLHSMRNLRYMGMCITDSATKQSREMESEALAMSGIYSLRMAEFNGCPRFLTSAIVVLLFSPLCSPFSLLRLKSHEIYSIHIF